MIEFSVRLEYPNWIWMILWPLCTHWKQCHSLKLDFTVGPIISQWNNISPSRFFQPLLHSRLKYKLKIIADFYRYINSSRKSNIWNFNWNDNYRIESKFPSSDFDLLNGYIVLICVMKILLVAKPKITQNTKIISLKQITSKEIVVQISFFASPSLQLSVILLNFIIFLHFRITIILSDEDKEKT